MALFGSLSQTIAARLVLLVAAVALPLGCLLALEMARQMDNARADALARAARGARVILARVEDHVLNVESILHSVQAALPMRPQAVDAGNATLARIRAGLPDYFGSLSVLQPDGGMLYSAESPPPRPGSVNVADRRYFRQAMASGRLSAGDPIVSRTSGLWIVVLARRIEDPATGAVTGVVSASTVLTRFQQIFADTALPPGSVVTVVNDSGLVLSRSVDPEKWIGRDISQVPSVARALREREGAQEMVAADGVTRLSAYATASRVPWLVYVGIPTESAIAPARAQLSRAITLAGLVSVLALLAAAWIGRGIARPLRQLARDAATLAGGELGHRSAVSAGAELGELAARFNAMADSLQRERAVLLENESRYRSLFESSLDMIHAVGTDGRISDANPIECEKLGYGRDELVGRPALDIVHPEHRAATAQAIGRVLAGERIGSYETVLLTREGHALPVEVSAFPELSAGALVGARAIIRDIAERKRAEALLEGHRQVLEMMAGGTPLARSLDALARLIEAQSPGMLCSILLLDDEGKHVRHGAAPSLPAEFMHAIDGAPIGPRAGSCGTAVWRREPVVVEDIETDPLWEDYRAIAAPHSLRACWSTPIFDTQGGVLGTFAIYYRVPRRPTPAHLRLIELATHTAALAISRAHEEAALRHSEQRFRLAASGGQVWEWNVTTGEVNFPPEFWRRLGYEPPRSETAFARFVDLLHPKDVEPWRSAVRTHIQQRLPYELEYRARASSGEYFWFRTVGQAVWDESGRATYMAGTAFDVTERKRAEQALRASEAMLRQYVENTPAAVAMLDTDMRYLLTSRRWRTDYRLADQDLTGRSHYEVFPETPEQWKEIHRRCLAGAVERADEDPFPRADGITDWVRWEVRPWYKSEGVIGGITIFSELITERKRAEQALREAATRLEAAISAGHVGLWDWDMRTNQVHYSPEWKRQIGYNENEISNDFEEWRSRVHPEDLEHALQTVQDYIAHPRPDYSLEFRLRHKDGSYRWIFTQAALEFDEQGKPVRMLGSHVDVTEQHRLVAERLALGERITRLMENMSDAFVALDRDWRYVYLNRRAGELFGRDPAELVGKHIWTEFPEGVGQPFHRAYLRAMEERQSVQIEAYYPPWDRWYENRIYPSEEGLSIFFTDITERKRADEKIRQSEQLLRDLIDGLGPYIFVGLMTPDGVLIEANRPALVAANLDPADVLGKHVADTYWWTHSADAQAALRAAIRRASQGIAVRYDTQVQVAGGEHIWIDFSIQPLFDADGRIRFLIPSAIVISERKHAEEALRRAAEELRQVSARLAQAQETERRTLANELHDQVGQNLTALNITLTLLKGELAHDGGAQASERLDDSLGLVSATVGRVRDLMVELRPPMLDDYGLLAALRWYATRFGTRTGLDVQVDGEEPRPRLSGEAEIALFRIAQEALNNVAKHAGAGHVRVALEAGAAAVRLRIEDDGIGFDAALRPLAGGSVGWGIAGMRERATAAGGSLRVDSAPGKGTRVQVEMARP